MRSPSQDSVYRSLTRLRIAGTLPRCFIFGQDQQRKHGISVVFSDPLTRA
ncbi:hypothetical protein [Candidatus Thiodiazotropha sp. CDECU1]|nr:hypothetical protein [Candidatus Thiodiazotropha sp. CDECU1]